MHYQIDPIKLHALMKTKGLHNLSQLANATGLHRNTLHRIFKGESPFTHAVETLSQHLQIDPLSLLSSILPGSNKIKDIEKLGPIIQSLAAANKEIAIFLLGSRTTQKAKPYSDWDIGICAYPHPINGKLFLKYKNLTEELAENLPYKIDLINLNAAPDWFLESIQNNFMFLAGNEKSKIYFEGILNGIQKKQVS